MFESLGCLTLTFEMKGNTEISEIILEMRMISRKYRDQYALRDMGISLQDFCGDDGRFHRGETGR